MQKNYKIYQLLVGWLLAMATGCWQEALAQQSTLLKSAGFSKMQTRDQVVDVFESQGKTVQVFSNELGTRKITVGDFAGLPYNRTQSGFIIGGRRIALREGEELVGHHRNQVLTQQTNYGQTYSTTLRSYQLTGSALRLNNSTTLPGLEYTFYTDSRAGVLLISDASEGEGYTFALYNFNAELIRTYQPFADGFNMSAIGFNEQYVTLATQVNRAQKASKLTLFDASTGAIVVEKDLSLGDFTITDLDPAGNHLIARGYTDVGDNTSFQTLGISTQGALLWKNDLILSKLITVKQDDQVLACGYYKGKILLLKPDNGQVLWNKSVSDLQTGGAPPGGSSKPKLLSFTTINDNAIAVLVAEGPGALTAETEVFPVAHLYILNARSELVQRVAFDHLGKKTKLAESSKQLILLQAQPKTVYSYEKNLQQGR